LLKIQICHHITNISQYFTILEQINAALVSTDLSITKKIVLIPDFW